MAVSPPYRVIPGCHSERFPCIFEKFPCTFQEFNMRVPAVWMPYKRRARIFTKICKLFFFDIVLLKNAPVESKDKPL